MSRRDLPVALGDKKSVLLSCHQVSGTGGFGEGIERLYFDFFRSKTTPATNQLFDCDFWSRGVPQLCHSEPSIKHAVLAISALHQGWDLYGSTSVDIDRNAVLQYSKAVESAKLLLIKSQSSRNPDKETVQKVLVACILFICFENLMGDYGSASMHLGNGLQILEDHNNAGNPLGNGSGPNPTFEAEIVELIQRYHFQALTFAQTRWPFRQASVRFHQGPPPLLPSRFETMSHVRSFLFEKVTWAMCVGEVFAMSLLNIPQHPVKDCATTLAESKLERDKILQELDLWWTLFSDFCNGESARTGQDITESVTYVWLTVYYQITMLLTTTGCTGVEISWDDNIADFEKILDRCEFIINKQVSKSPLSLEVGVCIPLFMSANKCRHPRLRRRAIALMDVGNRKEGIWETHPAARVCERLIAIEERNAKRMWKERGEAEKELLSEKDIPEEARVQTVFTEVSLPKKYVKMSCTFRLGGEGTPLTWVEDRVDF